MSDVNPLRRANLDEAQSEMISPEADVQIFRPPVRLKVRVEDINPAPLVSCLMVSRGNFEIARHAIDCFLRQTYSNRELIVVSKSSSIEFWDYLRPLEQAGVRAIKAHSTSSLGELRNISVSEANGQLVCLWDDDDLHDPSRLSRGIQILSATKAAAVFLGGLMVWWPSKRLLALSSYRPWEGSMIALRNILPPYPNLARTEDGVMLNALMATHDIVLADEPRLYCYTITGLNSWDEDHFKIIVRQARHVYHGVAYEKELDLLATRIPVRTYAATLENVRPRAGFCDYSLGEATRRRTTLKLACLHCGQQRQYRTEQLLEQFGSGVTLQQLRRRLAGCPLRGVQSQFCQIGYLDPLDG